MKLIVRPMPKGHFGISTSLRHFSMCSAFQHSFSISSDCPALLKSERTLFDNTTETFLSSKIQYRTNKFTKKVT
ncbi:unnamed protein product [Adineta ricciae]|uniref:Uncharacterized protein n=1 Tax=Adineta ricciae TaxID=249248 RepID=A0A815S7E8_ADIRI|nr:unnamed protein product [Adineta ricciae]